MADASPKFHPPEFLPTVEVVVPHDGLSFWQFMVAGSVAGVIEHTAMFPVDTIKTRMQTQSLPCKPSLNLRQSVSSLFKSDGLRGFYRGISAMGLGAAPAHAVYFSVYELFKELSGNPNSPISHASSGILATVASDAVFTPMDTVKQRLQLGRSPYSGVIDCARRVIREEGFRALYASYRTTVLMNAPFTAVHFATYEAAKRGLTEVAPGSEDDERLMVHATAGAAAGALAASLTTPLDVVKTQLQCQGVCGCERFSSSSIMDVTRSIIKRDGYVGLMRGWKPRMLFHAPAAAICWSAYESTKSFFQDMNNRDRGP